MGYDTSRAKTIVFAISAAIAGFAGALYTPYVGFVSPDLLGFVLSTETLIWVAVGGRATLIGPAIGAVLISAIASILGDRLVNYWQGIMGVAFVLIVLLFPAGIIANLIKSVPRREQAEERPNHISPLAFNQQKPASAPSLTINQLYKKFGDFAIDHFAVPVSSMGHFQDARRGDELFGSDHYPIVVSYTEDTP